MSNKVKTIKQDFEIAGRTLTFETGVLAPQADLSILATFGETVVLATVTSAPLKTELDYFPLSVEYQERLYAGGRIKGSRWVKRDGRPADADILKGRLVDRSIRPLFPKTYKKEVQVITTVLSVDMVNDPSMVASIAASAALSASSLPWAGPVAIVSVGYINGEYVLYPTAEQAKESNLDLVVSCTSEAIIMIEAGAKQVPDEIVLGGIDFGFEEGKKVIAAINSFAEKIGNKKEVVEKTLVNEDLKKQVVKLVDGKLEKVIENMAKKEGKSEEWDELVAAVAEAVGEESAKEAIEMVDNLKKDHIRGNILKGVRPDGRALEQVRPLSSMVGLLPRTHGSALFQRGATQVVSVATLGSTDMSQLLESAEGESEKHYIHHYIMPPFSTGEVGRVGSPSRREIGHGALAERALEAVIPSQEQFPYTIQIVSEVLSSNGSTSMASTCGSTLALMDAGVPIVAPVSGVAMGVIVEGDKTAIMTDIAGIEDFNGDMDFKVAGTTEGITALQLDVKTLALTPALLRKAMKQAHEGRAHILAHMLTTISEPRAEVSKLAPKVKSINIDVEKIGELIGPSGKVIKKIIADSGAQVNVSDDGTVTISGANNEIVDKAVSMVQGITQDPEAGQIFEGVVKRVQSFGAFVEILPGKEGMVHVSDMSTEYVSDASDVVTEGQSVTVRVKEIDQMGRLNLSMVLDPAYDEQKREARENGGGPRFGSRDRGDRNGGGRRPQLSSRGPRERRFGSDRPRGVRRDRNDGGPHFPTSRLVPSENGNRFER